MGHCQCARVHTSVLESPETVGGFGETEKFSDGRERDHRAELTPLYGETDESHVQMQIYTEGQTQ